MPDLVIEFFGFLLSDKVVFTGRSMTLSPLPIGKRNDKDLFFDWELYARFF